MTEDRTNPFPAITAPPEGGTPDTIRTMALNLDTTQRMALDPDAAPDTTHPAAQVATEASLTEPGPPWFKRKRFAFPSAVALVFLVIMLSTGGNDPGIFDRTRTAAELRADLANAVPSGAVGQSVRDGRFAFIVTSIESPKQTVTNRLGAALTAQGRFVIIRVDVTNIGYDPRTLTATNQFLVSDKGQRFATSAESPSLAGAETIFMKKVNPGHTVNNAPLLFDVPAGTTIASIELHDSASSTGVKVRLP